MRPVRLASLLLTLMFFPLAAIASGSTADTMASHHRLRVSTGVIEPQILHYKKVIPSPAPTVDAAFTSNAKLMLHLKLNKNGKVRDVRILKSDDPSLDKPVLEAVRQFNWLPARLDQHRVPVGVTLTVFVRQ
jgi:TonB family protein